MRTTAVVYALIALYLSETAAAQTGRINFDTTPDGLPIASGTAVDSLYAAAFGVTFEAVRCPACPADPHVYATHNCVTQGAISPPNVVSLYAPPMCSDISETIMGLIQATFSSPADSVCITVKPVRSSDFGVLRAFNGDGVEVATAHSSAGKPDYLCVAGPGITVVLFSGSGSAFVWLDDLVVRYSPETPTARHTWGALKILYR